MHPWFRQGRNDANWNKLNCNEFGGSKHFFEFSRMTAKPERGLDFIKSSHARNQRFEKFEPPLGFGSHSQKCKMSLCAFCLLPRTQPKFCMFLNDCKTRARARIFQNLDFWMSKFVTKWALVLRVVCPGHQIRRRKQSFPKRQKFCVFRHARTCPLGGPKMSTPLGFHSKLLKIPNITQGLPSHPARKATFLREK